MPGLATDKLTVLPPLLPPLIRARFLDPSITVVDSFDFALVSSETDFADESASSLSMRTTMLLSSWDSPARWEVS